jgi:hypothetical protein
LPSRIQGKGQGISMSFRGMGDGVRSKDRKRLQSRSRPNVGSSFRLAIPWPVALFVSPQGAGPHSLYLPLIRFARERKDRSLARHESLTGPTCPAALLQQTPPALARTRTSFAAPLSEADTPKIFIPMIRPDRPTYRSHPKVEPCSTATRAVTPGGKTTNWEGRPTRNALTTITKS